MAANIWLIICFVFAGASGRLQTKETEGEMIELDGLDVYTNYSIGVSAYTQAGRGKTSKSIFCRTAEDGNMIILNFTVYNPS